MTKRAAAGRTKKRTPIARTLWVAWMFTGGSWQVVLTGEDLKHVKGMVGGFGIRHRFVQYRALPASRKTGAARHERILNSVRQVDVRDLAQRTGSAKFGARKTRSARKANP